MIGQQKNVYKISVLGVLENQTILLLTSFISKSNMDSGTINKTIIPNDICLKVVIPPVFLLPRIIAAEEPVIQSDMCLVTPITIIKQIQLVVKHI
jgi:hypothetical protein